MNSEKERFLSKVDKDGLIIYDNLNPCWIWIGAKQNRGYGVFRFRGKASLAHRVSYVLFNGPIGDEIFVCHHCDNRPCVNPAHLFLGSNSDNIQDAIRKGRLATGDRSGSRKYPEKLNIWENHPMAKLTKDQVDEIRKLYRERAGSQHDIAMMFNISRGNVQNIVRGKIWRDGSEPIKSDKDLSLLWRIRKISGEKNANAKMTWDGVEQMKKEYTLGGISMRKLSKKYNISDSVCRRIIRGKIWRKL